MTPNYRIYDLTGSQVTHDIHADSLDEALESAREWMADGDWGEITSTIWLDYGVSPVIYHPAPHDPARLLPGQMVDEDGDIINPDGTVAAWHEDSGTINERAMSDAMTQRTLKLHPAAPDCAEGHEHDWQSPYEIVGGIRDNPGVWGHGGGVIYREVCAHCGAYKITDTWATRPDNGVQGLTSVCYEPATPDSVAWAESLRAS